MFNLHFNFHKPHSHLCCSLPTWLPFAKLPSIMTYHDPRRRTARSDPENSRGPHYLQPGVPREECFHMFSHPDEIWAKGCWLQVAKPMFFDVLEFWMMMRQCVSQSRCQRLQGHYRCSMRCLAGDGRDPDRSLSGKPKCGKSRVSIHHRIFLQTVLWHQQIRGTKALKCLLSPFHIDFRLGCRTDHRFNDMGLPLQLALSRYMGLMLVKWYWTLAFTSYRIIPPLVWLLYPLRSFFGQVLDSLGQVWRTDDKSNWIEQVQEARSFVNPWRTIWGHSPDCPETNWFGHLDAHICLTMRASQITTHISKGCSPCLRYKDKGSQASINTRKHFMLAVLGLLFQGTIMWNSSKEEG